MLTPTRLLAVIAASGVLLLGGCWSGDDDNTVGEPPVVVTDPNEVSAGIAHTVTLSDATSSMHGASVAFTADAFAGGKLIVSIKGEDAPPGPLPAQAVAAGGVFISKTLVLTHNQTGTVTFDAPVKVTMPFDASKLQAGDVPTVLYWNETAAAYQAMPVDRFDTAAKTVTFNTVHFSRFVVAVIPGLGALATTASASPVTALDVDTAMRPSADSFFRTNSGSYSAPGGNCLGMASYSDWFYEQAKSPLNAGKGLFQTYLEGDATQPNDDLIAEELIVRAHAAASQEWGRRQMQANTGLTDDQVAISLIQAMKLTGQPQLFLMWGNPNWWQQYVQGKSSWGHAVVAYKYDATAGAFAFYDPNIRGDDSAGVRYAPGSGFGTLLKQGSLPTEPEVFGFDSLNSIYGPADMKALFDGAAAGWSEGQFGRIDITSLTIDSATRSVRVTDRANVKLAGTVVSVGGQAGKEPNVMDVFVAGAKVNTQPLTAAGGFDFMLPELADGVTSDIQLVARREETSGIFFTRRTKSLYGTFSRFKIRTGTALQNWGFEEGTFNLWDSIRFLWGGSGQVTPSDKSVIVTPGQDPIASSIPMVLFGQYAARVNNQDNNLHISRLTREVQVPSDATAFALSFNWAAVLEDPQHDPDDQPYVDISVTVKSTGEVLYARRYYSNDPAYPGWQSFQGGQWKVIDWQPVNLLGLERLHGETVVVKVEAADCALSGHGGYAYIDADE
ncbi:MAG: hypothetical protein LCH73_00250 [Proteobacteria bacterium]|nr:hypothetical protein [Pseudomonadota bacterium]